MKKAILLILIYCFLFSNYVFSQYVLHSGYDFISSAQTYAQTNYFPYSIAQVSMIKADPVYYSGYAFEWSYDVYADGYSVYYRITYGEFSSGGYNIHGQPVEHGMQVHSPLKISGVSSTDAYAVAESNGGYNFRNTYSNTSNFISLQRSSDILSGITPYWFCAYYSNGTLGFYSLVDATTGSLISTKGGQGGGNSSLKENVDKTNILTSGNIFKIAETNYWLPAYANSIGKVLGFEESAFYIFYQTPVFEMHNLFPGV